MAMDSPEDRHSEEEVALDTGSPQRSRQLPDDLPTSLNDRRPASFQHGVEVYDPWEGQTKYITSATPTSRLAFDLSLDAPSSRDLGSSNYRDNDARLNQMLAAQAAYQEGGSSASNITAIANDKELPDSSKKQILQQALNTAASNGDLTRLTELLAGEARAYIDIDQTDEEGTAPLIYASCFGHEDVVKKLVEAGAEVDKRDGHQWTSLMWATTNRHRNIMKVLLDHGASAEAKSSAGRTAFDFVEPDSEISDYLHDNGYDFGYRMGGIGGGDDFYSSGVSQDRFEEEVAENEMKRRMMMESAINLEVDLGNLGLDEQPESPAELEEEGNEFVWDRCLNDQMFVFQESELGRILDIIITHMTPQRTPSQKPVPANILFLSARYAHYHANPELLASLLVTAMEKINNVVERCQWDMTMLAFWISNATLLLHYLKKDSGLVGPTTDFQAQLAELINEIFVLIIRDAERRMDKVFDPGMLDHETIAGFEDVHFQNEWKIFRYKPKAKAPEPLANRFRPPSPKRRAKPSPRNITSLLSSTLFVLDLYDIHSVITMQIIAQLLYWLGAELFNRVMSNRKYLARTKAMQVRMNISVLEDWARSNSRQAEHYENGSTIPTGENTVEAARYHLNPVIQLLQWLQVLSSLGEQTEAIDATIEQLPRLSTQQLMHAVKYYRAEVGEKVLTKAIMKHLQEQQQKQTAERRAARNNRKSLPAGSSGAGGSVLHAIDEQGPASPSASGAAAASTPLSPTPTTASTASSTNTARAAAGHQRSASGDSRDEHHHSLSGNGGGAAAADDDDDAPEHLLLLDAALMLPFSLPTSTDMLVSYGAGFGGVNRERERRYIPTVPPEFLAKLDLGGGGGGGGGGTTAAAAAQKRADLYAQQKWSDDDESV